MSSLLSRVTLAVPSSQDSERFVLERLVDYLTRVQEELGISFWNIKSNPTDPQLL